MLEEFPEAIILRPSIVFGPEDEFFNRFARLGAIGSAAADDRRRTHAFPAGLCRGCRQRQSQRRVRGSAQPGTVYELGGPEVVTFRQLLDSTQQWAGRQRGYFPMPFWLAKLMALADLAAAQQLAAADL